jgi:hypothetical protein
MPREFDWRNLPTGDHEGQDPLSRFAAETRPPAQRSELPSPPQAPEPRPGVQSATRHPHLPPLRSRLSWPASRVAVLLAFVSVLAFAAAYVWGDRTLRKPHDATPATAVAGGAAASPDTAASSKGASTANSVAASATSGATEPTALPLAVDGGAFSPSFATTGSTLCSSTLAVYPTGVWHEPS